MSVFKSKPALEFCFGSEVFFPPKNFKISIIVKKREYAKIMPMEKAVVNWIKTSDYDISTAKALFKAKRYVYVIFLCHLSVEKLLKAVV